MKDNTQYVTLSYSILRNSGRGGLIGSSETRPGNSFITFHHNLYENIDSRTPLLRGGIAHMYNNYYVSLNESGINSRAGAKAKVDNNYFQDSKDVLGTFYTTRPATGRSRQRLRQRDLVQPRQREQPRRARTRSPTPRSASRTPTASTRPAACRTSWPDGRRQHGPEGVERQLLAADARPPHRPRRRTTPRRPPPDAPADHADAAQRDQPQPRAGADGSSKASGTSYGNVRTAT